MTTQTPHRKHCILLAIIHAAGAAVTCVTHSLAAALLEIVAAATYLHMALHGGDTPPHGGEQAPTAAPEADKDASSLAGDPATGEGA